MTGTVMPTPIQTLLDTNGDPISGGKLYCYIAGTSTPLDTYTEATLATPNANPVVADSAGRMAVWLGANLSYKFVAKTSADVTVWTVDAVENIPGTGLALDITGTAGENLALNDVVYLASDAGSGGTTPGSWYKTDADNTYSSSSASIVGMVPAAITSAASGTIRLQGRLTGLSSLTTGDIYYASATAGLLTATAPTNAVFVGAADSTTSIVIQPSSSATAGLDSRVTALEGEMDTVQADVTGIGGVNLIKDAAFLIWAAGDALAPTHWTLSGAGAAIARETSAIKIGAMSAKLTAGGGATGYLMQDLLPAATYDANWLDTKKVSLGAWVYATVASKIRLYIDDGATNSSSSYHTGGSTWEWLTVTHTIDASATYLSSGFSAAQSAVGYLSGPTLLLSSSPPTRYQPSPCMYGVIRFGQAGTVATGAQLDTWVPARPAIIKQVQLYCKTAPTDASLIVDINTWDGSAFTTAFTTKPTILTTANSGGATPDGTYARRCLSTYVATTAYPTSAGQFMTWDIDQVGSTVAGADLGVFVRMLQYTSPLEAFLGVTEIS